MSLDEEVNYRIDRYRLAHTLLDKIFADKKKQYAVLDIDGGEHTEYITISIARTSGFKNRYEAIKVVNEYFLLNHGLHSLIMTDNTCVYNKSDINNIITLLKIRNELLG